MNRIEFEVNGTKFSVGEEVSSTTTLLDYIRTTLELRGTKYMCLEGGCGACIVSVITHPGDDQLAVTSCMVSVTSCHGWQITTIEKLGNRKDGYHPLQKALASHNGTQCGYCSPGFVMSMYSKLKSRKNLKMLDIERDLSSNICRCTGFRPILEAFKKFASDAPESKDLLDIEELEICQKPNRFCSGSYNYYNDFYFVSKNENYHNNWHINLKDGKTWHKAFTVDDILNILTLYGLDSYMLVAGNTGKGVIPIEEYPRNLIDISGVKELKGYLVDQNLVIGAGLTISNLMEIFQEISDTENFEYLKVVNDHLQYVGNIAIRNIGTVAGNLMVKHKYPQFASDLFLLFQVIGVELTIRSFDLVRTVTMENFMKEDMKGIIILNALFPPRTKMYKLITYKVAAKSRNAPAIVNAGFIYKLNSENQVLECRITFGGFSSDFSRATNTEKALIKKQLFSNDTLQEALQILSTEIKINKNPSQSSVAYRKQLALGLFYKSLLSIGPDNIIHPRYKSGALKLHEIRPVSKASQSYDTNLNLWPLTQPIPKFEALIQCAGESEYAEDLPRWPNEVYAAFVLSTVGIGTIENIDASKALQLDGVIAFYTASDIPGLNSFTPVDGFDTGVNEEVLCMRQIKYYNQPIGLVIAEDNTIAQKAALLVKVTYSNVQVPKIDIRINKMDSSKTTLYYFKKATSKGSDIKKVIGGNNSTIGQYHFCLENMAAISWPLEDSLKVRPTSHFIDSDQLMISRNLNIEQSSIDIAVRRVGGSFGIKLSRQTLVSCSSSLGAYKLNRPCRMTLPMSVQMRAIGKRMASSTVYELGVNHKGLIQYINYDIYYDNGYIVNERLIQSSIQNFLNCYRINMANFKCFDVITDTASNTWFRCPTTVECIASTEFIMERISYELGIDPLQVRLTNLDTDRYGDLVEMIKNIQLSSNFEERKKKVKKFNTENRWKKRGIRLVPMRWSITLPFAFNVTVSVYHGDGSVAITHGGVEIGQGIHTKVIQVCAYCLSIPVDKIKIKRTNSIDSPNSSHTAASKTTQNILIGVKRACKNILERLEPIKTKITNPTWERVISKAHQLGINLQGNGFVDFNDETEYNVYGVAVSEVEVDIITGEWEIIRVDILEDVGQSISPLLDIGQIEGAFIMSLGFWTTEELKYNNNTGQILTDRTWNYFVPQATEIPQDFRVNLLNNSYNKKTMFGSKALSEPPMSLGVVVPLAMREALVSARTECGIPSTQWFNIDGPHTVEKLCLSSGTKIDHFKFY